MKMLRLTGEYVGGLVAGAGLGMNLMVILVFYGLPVPEWAIPMVMGCGLLAALGGYIARKAQDHRQRERSEASLHST